jgi:ABC-type transporter Mla subunit MlaD
MDERVIKFRVGVMVVSTVLIVGILVALFGKLPIWQEYYTIHVLLPEAPGVTRDTPVRKFGILIGRVSEVQFAEDDPRFANRLGAVVTLKIRKDVRIRRNEVCQLTSTILGDAVLTFVPSTSLQQSNVIEGEPLDRPDSTSTTRPGLTFVQADNPDNEFIGDDDVIQGSVRSNPLQVLSNL